MIVVVLLLLTLSIYYSAKWEDKRWKKIVSNSQIVLYTLYYILLCWIILESELNLFKDYLLQTYFVCTSLWNQLYCIKYRYQIIVVYQIGFVSISLAVSKIFEDVWTYIINMSAFLILLFTVEMNGQFVQKQLYQSDVKQQQEQGILNSPEGLFLKSDKNITRYSVGMQQLQSYQPTENVILNYDQSVNINHQLIERSLKRVNTNSFGTPVNKHLSPNNKILSENKGLRFQEFISNYNQENTPIDFQSEENILREDEIISHENSIYKSGNQSKELDVFNNQINMKIVQQQSQDKVESERICQSDDDDNRKYIFSKKVCFNGEFIINQRQKKDSCDSNKSQSSKLIRREIFNNNSQKTSSSHQTIEQLIIKNSVLKKDKSIQSTKTVNQKQKKKYQENQDNLLLYQENNDQSEQNQPVTPWLPSNPSSDIQNLQEHYQNNINKILQNDQSKPTQTYQHKQDQLKLPSFSNLKNEFHFLQKYCEDKNLQQTPYNLNSEIGGENNKQQSDDNIQQPRQQHLDNTIDFKLTFNDFQKNQQIVISNTPKTPPRTMSRSLSQNPSRVKSTSVRQKLNDLEKSSKQTSDYLITSEKLINYKSDNNEKCAFCQNIIKQRYIQKNDKQPQQNSQFNNKTYSKKEETRKSILSDQIEENIQRINFENIIYNKIDCGIIFIDSNISITYTNKQIQCFFHLPEVNDNLMNHLKLVCISDQSIVTLKQFLLSSNKLNKQRNVNILYLFYYLIKFINKQIQEINQAKTQAIWSLNQINDFLNKLNPQSLKEDPVSLKWFLERIFQIFCQKELKEYVNDLVIEVFQVLFSQKDNEQQETKDGQNAQLFMAVQFKIHFYYNSEKQEYQSFICIVNTGQRDLSIKKQISETLSYRIFQTLSHEFGTYMNIISNITENALEDDRVPVDLKKDYFRIINTNSLLLENLIKDMRHFFQIMNQKLEIKWSYINLKETIFQTLELFKKQFQLKKLKVSIKIQKGVQQYVNSDGQFIKQILSNFISNSLKFTLSGQIKVFLFKHSNKYLRLEVEDSGIGMTYEEGEKLKGMLKNGFTDQKISKNSVGLGFGLLISNNLARMIGNPQKKQAIYFQSQPKGGSKFWILINQYININSQPISSAHNKKISFFSKQIQENQMKSLISDTSRLINPSQMRVKGLQNNEDMIKNKQNLVKSKSLTFNMNKPTLSINGQVSIQDQHKKGEKSSPQLERIMSNSCIQTEGDSQKPDNRLLRKISQLSTSMMKKSTNKEEMKISNSSVEQPFSITEHRKSSFHIQNSQLQEREINKNPQRMLKQSRTATIMHRDNSSQNIGGYEENESSTQIQKKNYNHSCEKDNLKRFHKRKSTFQPNFNLNVQGGLPIKLQQKNSINGIGSIPSQGLSNESSQMISSRIIQIRSRAKHTITSKSQQSSQQINIFQLNQVNELSVNISEQYIDEPNKNNQQISKQPQSTFETPNFFKLGAKNCKTSLEQSSLGQVVLEVQKKESLSVPQHSNKNTKESMNSINQSNQLQRSSISNLSNFINTSTSNYQNSRQQTYGSSNNQNNNEQNNKRFQQNKKDNYSSRCSVEWNLLSNNPQNNSKQQHTISIPQNTIGELNGISQLTQQSDCNQDGEQQYISQNNRIQSFQQNKSSKYLEQRIVEELFEDDTKNNNSSDQNSSNNNLSDHSSFTMTPKSNKNSNNLSQFKQKQGMGNTNDKVQLSGFTSYYQQQQAAQQVRKLSISTTLKKNDDSDCSLLNTTNNSVSIEFVAQRDIIEYSDYEFDENHSLDDLDQTMHNQYKTIFQQNTAQSYLLSPLKNIKAFSSQQTSNSTSKQISSQNQNVDKFFNDFNPAVDTINDIKAIKIGKCFDVSKIQEEQTENKLSDQTFIENDDEEINKFTIPSERKLQKYDSIEKYDLSKTLISKCKLNIESRDLIQIQKIKMINHDSETKVQQNEQEQAHIDRRTSLQNNDRRTSIQVQNSSNQRLPSITLNLKNQKLSTQPSIQEQKMFSFGGDEKFSGGDTNNQTNQAINGEGKNIHQRLSLPSGLQRNNSQHNYSQYFVKIPITQDNAQLSQQVQQQQNAQQQYKIYKDQNILQLNLVQQQNQQSRFNNCNQIYPQSNHTLSNINADEYEEKQPNINNNNKLYLNTNLQNLQSQKKILIVDDEIFNIYSLKLIFSKFGLKDHILEAYNGQQAIDQIMNQQNIKSKRNNELGNQIGMIIMDVNMPIMNGIECTKYIRELESNQTLSYAPKIIGYTAYSDSETRECCYDAGMDDLLLKPSRRDDFISVLEKYYLNC